MQFKVAPTTRSECSAEEWQARVDLAAAHRLAYMHGFSEGIFNHLTLIVPGRKDRYYQIPFGMHWSEVKASSFMEVGFDGLVKRGVGDVEQSAYAIHMPMHRARPQHCAAVFHTHMPYTSALTRLEDPRIKEIGQTEVGMMGKIAYDDNYDGPACDPTEGDRLARILGDKTILFMANHGVTTVGTCVAEAYDRLYYIERVAQVQIYAMWTGQRLKQLPDEIVAKTRRDYGNDSERVSKMPKYDPPPAIRHFDALKRILDRKEPDYAE
jgi:ribulose-5-phosphate 4-epimerase/fuculose-1-phosphate aldolase